MTAFKLGWIADDDLWVGMIEDRNRTSHTYDRKIAQAVYANIGNYLIAYQGLTKNLQNILNSIQ